MSAPFSELGALTVKRSWASAPLREICEFHNGLWKGKKEPFETATVIRNTNFTVDGRIDLSDVAILEVEARQLAKRCLHKNDIIIEKSGGGPKQPVGRVVLFDLVTDGKYSFSNFTSAMRVVKPNEVDPIFLHRVLHWWYTSGRTEAIQSHSTGIRNLDFNAYKDFVVPVPPLDEQKRIVAVLDQAFAALDRARAHAEANLADAEALFVRLAYDNLRKVAETGKFAPVGEISDHCLGKMLDRNKNKGTFRPYLRNINVRWFEVDTSDILEMRIEDRELDRYEVRKGDLLICEGGYPGRASIYEGDAPTYFQKALHRVRFSDESLAKVLMYWLFVEDKLGKLKDCFSGTGISHFTGKTLASYLMPMSDPPTNARAVENIDRHLAWTNSVISGYRQKLTDLANLRQSLLQKAFSGELT